MGGGRPFLYFSLTISSPSLLCVSLAHTRTHTHTHPHSSSLILSGAILCPVPCCVAYASIFDGGAVNESVADFTIHRRLECSAFIKLRNMRFCYLRGAQLHVHCQCTDKKCKDSTRHGARKKKLTEKTDYKDKRNEGEPKRKKDAVVDARCECGCEAERQRRGAAGSR